LVVLAYYGGITDKGNFIRFVTTVLGFAGENKFAADDILQAMENSQSVISRHYGLIANSFAEFIAKFNDYNQKNAKAIEQYFEKLPAQPPLA
jgi:hypothetical protein